MSSGFEVFTVKGRRKGEMAEIAVTTVIDKLMSLVDEEARLLGGIHNQVEDIKIELLYIQAFLKDADAKSDTVDISHGLKTWIQDLRKTAYSMEDLIDEYMLHFANRNQNQNQNPRRWFFGFPGKVARSIQKLKPRHEMASKIRDMKKKIGKLKETGSSYVFITSSVEPESSSSTATTPWHDQRVTSLFVDETEIVGIDPQRNELITQLVEERNPKRTVISVVGMGGLGKTTLTKKVYDNRRVVGHFDCHAWITVSQSFKMEELIRNMAKKFYQGRKEGVPEGIDTIDEMSLITLIRQYLQDKRYDVFFILPITQAYEMFFLFVHVYVLISLSILNQCGTLQDFEYTPAPRFEAHIGHLLHIYLTCYFSF